MKTIVAPDAGVLRMGMTVRAERLGRSTLQAKLLQTSLWKPVRLPTTAKAGPIARMVVSPSGPTAPRAATSVRKPLNRAAMSASKIVAGSTRTTNAPTRTPFALSSSSHAQPRPTRSSASLQRAVAGKGSVIGPVTPGGSGRARSLAVVARGLTQRGSPRETAKQPASGGGARARLVSPGSQAQHRSRPASALAAQTGRGSERGLPSPSGRTSSRAQVRSASRSASGAGAAGDSGGDSAVIVLSGDVVIDGRRLGEVAVSSAARSGSSAQTGARSPNFRRTALPSGLSAPLP